MTIHQSNRDPDNDNLSATDTDGSDSPLAMRIRDLIRHDGPMGIAEYMSACLFDPGHGYYTTRVPFGAHGDFITAPDVSQMFGELIGIWCAATWQAMGSPPRFNLVEMGPGRGTMMADTLRAASTVPGFNQGAEICMVETSPRLRELQVQTLKPYIDAGFRIGWHDRLEDVPRGPMIFVANELFDALPFRQYQKTSGKWLERCVGLDEAHRFVMVKGTRTLDPDELPGGHEKLEEGAIFEKSPAREALAEMLARRVVDEGGAALLIDYGHSAPGTGDTFQALKDHEFVSPLDACGMADLTSHVDFSALFAVMKSVKGATVTPPMEQGEFLTRMGLVERVRQLGQGKTAEQQARLLLDMERLAGAGDGSRSGAGGMGTIFKVMMVAQPGLLPPPFQAPSGDDPAYGDMQ